MAAPTSSGAPDPSYATHAWLRDGKESTPGVLTLHDGRLSFVEGGTVVFDECPAASEVDFPWYRFGGELRVTAGGHRHRIALTPPHGAVDADEPADDPADARDGRRAGRIWRTLLAH